MKEGLSVFTTMGLTNTMLATLRRYLADSQLVFQFILQTMSSLSPPMLTVVYSESSVRRMFLTLMNLIRRRKKRRRRSLYLRIGDAVINEINLVLFPRGRKAIRTREKRARKRMRARARTTRTTRTRTRKAKAVMRNLWLMNAWLLSFEN